MKKSLKAQKIYEILDKRYPEASCSLDFDSDPFKLLIMARLSAQCTDARVNIVAKELFSVYKNAQQLAQAQICDIEKIIKPCGLFRTKAKSIKEMSIKICNDFSGEVPSGMDELLSLPGVGRKIANLIRGDVFGINGIVADTHCIRLSGRLGFTKSKNPIIVERDLEKAVPKNIQSQYCHLMVYFGRDICRAQSPLCDMCPLKEQNLCSYKRK